LGLRRRGPLGSGKFGCSFTKSLHLVARRLPCLRLPLFGSAGGVFLSSGLEFRLSNLKPELSILLGKRLLDDVQCVRRLTYLTFKH
jgi:hypothetical protein